MDVFFFVLFVLPPLYFLFETTGVLPVVIAPTSFFFCVSDKRFSFLFFLMLISVLVFLVVWFVGCCCCCRFFLTRGHVARIKREQSLAGRRCHRVLFGFWVFFCFFLFFLGGFVLSRHDRRSFVLPPPHTSSHKKSSHRVSPVVLLFFFLIAWFVLFVCLFVFFGFLDSIGSDRGLDWVRFH